AYTVSGSWSEGSVTWNTRPGYTGTAATTTSGPGWCSWTVTAHVGAMYSGTKNGFVLMDANAGSAFQWQIYWSRESGAANTPQLIVNWG
ncbi:DNRLRE domain-containing protein, partial [bacterium]|nr:DNRLRE domain-containing protein [bacterium]